MVESGDGQAVRLPAGFRIDADRVRVRRAGDAVTLEPLRPEAWPENFFEAIRIEDPTFARPPQGTAPEAPRLG